MQNRKVSPRIVAVTIITILAIAGIGGAAVAWARQPKPNSIVEALHENNRTEAAAALSTQQDPLADGVVTDAEYDAAVAQTVQCLDMKGVRSEVQPRSGKRPPSVGFVVGTLGEGKAARKDLASCKTQYLSAIDAVYRAQFLVSDQRLQDGNQWIGGCLKARGYQVPGGSISYEQILAWHADPSPELRMALAQCNVDRQAALGF